LRYRFAEPILQKNPQGTGLSTCRSGAVAVSLNKVPDIYSSDPILPGNGVRNPVGWEIRKKNIKIDFWVLK
jgi:hypothetical protein